MNNFDFIIASVLLILVIPFYKIIRLDKETKKMSRLIFVGYCIIVAGYFIFPEARILINNLFGNAFGYDAKNHLESLRLFVIGILL